MYYTTYVRIYFKLLGANEFSPAFNPNSYSPAVLENAAVSHLVTTVTATDSDHGSDGGLDLTQNVESCCNFR